MDNLSLVISVECRTLHWKSLSFADLGGTIYEYIVLKRFKKLFLDISIFYFIFHFC